jgi:AraC family transcriptional regulator
MGATASLAARRIQVLRGTRRFPVVPGTHLRLHWCWDGFTFEQHCSYKLELPEHEHPTDLLALQTGPPVRMEWRTGGRTRITMAEPGNLLLLPRGTRDAVRWDGRHDRSVVALEARQFQQAIAEPTSGRELELREKWNFRDRQIELLLLAIKADLEAGCPAGRLYGESLGHALSVYLARQYAVFKPKIAARRGGMPKTRLNRVLDFIKANVSEDLTLSELARTAGMGPHYFCELFKQSTGLSPHQYVIRRKIELAKELLADPRIRIIEASARTGFVDQSHFTKVFHRVVGVTPSEFRDRL